MKNFLIHFVSWTLLQLLVVDCQIPRFLHTATVVDNKLYILGGILPQKEFIYLDFSHDFSTKSLVWNNLTSFNTIPPHADSASVAGGANNDTLILYGGYKESNDMELVYTFESQNNTWSSPIIASSVQIKRKRALLGIVDNSGKMYLWSGFDPNVNSDMLILDSINLTWEMGNVVGAPIGRGYYGAALLPDQSIIYMGGALRHDSVEIIRASLNQVYLYDTIKDTWITKTTSGMVPSDRDGLSIVLGLDGQRIILFGGKPSSDEPNLAPEEALYVLDLNNFEWSVPKVSGKIPSSRSYHKANLIGKYMVISFGLGYSQLNESDVLLLDISNDEEYIWTEEFSLSSQQHSIVGAIVGALGAVILVSLGCFFIYRGKKKQDQKHHHTLIPGSDESKEEYTDKGISPISNAYQDYQEVKNEIANNETNKNYKRSSEAIPLLTQNILENEAKENIV